MSKTKKWLIPLIVLLICGFTARFIFNNPPENRRGGKPNAPQMTVQVQTITPTQYTVVVDSFGTVQPTTQSALVAQVSGQIVYVSPQFRNGGFFEQGDALVRIDPRDYVASVKIAEASLISAKQVLLEEQASAKQAQIDWQRLGNGEPASDLVLRKPQVAAAKARLLSAEAGLTRAKLALERTEIKAPYAGRVLRQLVDFGQVVGNNAKLADIYSTDSVEIRLPINNNDIGLINLPEEFRTNTQHSAPIEARLTSSLSSDQTWLGKIVRSEASIDTNSQQLNVVAQIMDPYNQQLHPGTQVKIGQYVSAEVQGRRLSNAILIDNRAIYQGSYVYVVEQGLLKRRDIQIRWQNNKEALIGSGLIAGEKVVLTPLGQVSSGTPVLIEGDNSNPPLGSYMVGKKGGAEQSQPDRQARLQKAADRMGISVEELKARRKNGAGKEHSKKPTRPAGSAEAAPKS